MSATQNTMAYRRRNREKGLCSNCTAPAAPGRTLCERHLKRQAERTQRLRAERKQQGQCACGAKPRRGYATCPACAERNRENARLRQEVKDEMPAN